MLNNIVPNAPATQIRLYNLVILNLLKTMNLYAAHRKSGREEPVFLRTRPAAEGDPAKYRQQKGLKEQNSGIPLVHTA
jgi:hypothetical protein